MNKDQVVEHCNTYMSKISAYYGYSSYQKTLPYLYIEDSPYSDSEDTDLQGEYCAMHNDLTIYWKNIKTEKQIVQVLLHEYQHYLQSPSWMTRYYNQGYTYSNHPYEVQAYKEEDNWVNFIN